MYSRSIFLWIYLSLKSMTMAQTYASIDCKTVTSSGFGTNGHKRVSCSDAGSAYSNYIMTGCGWWSPWMDTVDSIIDDSGEESECVANTAGSTTGRVQAVAQCCDIGDFVQCDTVENTGSGSAIATCSSAFPTLNPAFIDVVGCVSPGEACADTNNCDNVLTMGNGLITTQQCTGHQQANSGGIADIQSVCCGAISDEGTMECQQIIGQATGTRNDASSEISCKETLGSEWFLTSCGEYVQTAVGAPEIDGHHAYAAGSPANDVCRVMNSGFNGVTYPVAQCCRIETRMIPTEKPTPEPTNKPTPEPTPVPTDSPTPGPTPIPTDSPTPEPTDSPSRSPTMDGCDFDLQTYLEECYCDGTQPGLNLGSAHNFMPNYNYENNNNDVFRLGLDEFNDKFDSFLEKYQMDNDYNYNVMMMLIFTNCVTIIGLIACGCYNLNKSQQQRRVRYGKVYNFDTTDDEQVGIKR